MSGLGKSPRGRNDKPLQYSSLESLIDWGTWWAEVHWVAKSQTWFNYWKSTHTFLNSTTHWHVLISTAVKETIQPLLMQHSVQFSHSVMSNFVTPWTVAHQTSLSITNTQEPILTHVCHVGDAIQPSHPLSSPSPPAFNLPQHQDLFKWSVLHIRCPKHWSFSFNISPSNEHLGLISFRMDWLDLLAVQGNLKSFLQHHSSKASTLQWSAFFVAQISHPYITTGKNIPLTGQIFIGKVLALLFNTLSRLVIAFLWRSKCLLISWLQSPSAVILEPAAYTHQEKKKVSYCFHCFPIYLQWSDETGCHDLSFLNVEF